MKFSTKVQLSIMMILQFIAAGAITPIFSLYLKDYLHFDGIQTGLIIGTSSIAAFVSPLVTSFIADKIISAERLYTICQFGGAVVMGILAFQINFMSVLLLYLFYSIIIGPTFALINAIIFHNASKEDSKNYGFLRVWGTIGWIIVAWIFYFYLNKFPEKIPDVLKLSCITTFMLSIFSLTFPKTHARAKSESFIPIESIKVIIKPEIIFLLLFGLCINMLERYFYYGAAPFLKSIGFENKLLMPIMSLGQISEIIAMLLTGLLIKKLGYKIVMIFGLLMEMIRFSGLFFGKPLIFVLSGLFVHGFAYTFYYVPFIIFLDSHCSKKARTGVHQLSTIFTTGFGNFLGSMIAGIVIDHSTVVNIVDFKKFWTVPIIITILSFFILLFFINEKNKNKINIDNADGKSIAMSEVLE
jgi:nucleoside transporter